MSQSLWLNSHLTCFRRGFIAQMVEHRTGIAEVMGSNPVGASDFFLGFICNCLSYFTTARITFTCILYPQCTHMIFTIYTSCSSLFLVYWPTEYPILWQPFCNIVRNNCIAYRLPATLRTIAWRKIQLLANQISLISLVNRLVAAPP